MFLNLFFTITSLGKLLDIFFLCVPHHEILNQHIYCIHVIYCGPLQNRNHCNVQYFFQSLTTHFCSLGRSITPTENPYYIATVINSEVLAGHRHIGQRNRRKSPETVQQTDNQLTWTKVNEYLNEGRMVFSRNSTGQLDIHRQKMDYLNLTYYTKINKS